MRNIIACKDFSGYNGKTFQIWFMQAAYNVQTKETRIYAEFERVNKDVIRDNLQRMGAASIVIDSFSSVGWDIASQAAIKSVVECGETPGFTLFQAENPCVSPPGFTETPGFTKLIHNNQNTNEGIYVLRLTNKPTPFFYVGKAINIEHRIAQHASGSGALCITGEPFERVEPVTKMSADDMESWERNEVLARMFEFGIDNVRGWMYTLRTMPLEQKLSAFDQICEKLDRCRKCGRGTHFVRDCHALSADLWTCGMELRTVYRGASTEVANAECQVALAERRIAEAALADAERRIAEAARVLMTAGANAGMMP